jgi:hypothetical protein
MEYILIKTEEMGEEIQITLNKEELKVIHNIGVDIINQYPEMITIKNAVEKIALSFNNQQPLN